MGWKSTKVITREEAIKAIMQSLDETPYDEMSNEELTEVMYQLDIGDDENKPYYGHNFLIADSKDETDNP